MYSPDVNVLLAAMDVSHDHHESAQRFLWSRRLSSMVLLPAVMSAFVRLSSNPKVAAKPLRPSQAAAMLASAIDEGGWSVAAPTAAHWRAFTELVEQSRVGHSKVTDAWLAAQAMDLNLTWVTFDRDFRAFDGLVLLELD